MAAEPPPRLRRLWHLLGLGMHLAARLAAAIRSIFTGTTSFFAAGCPCIMGT
jgi:hypothetical protein